MHSSGRTRPLHGHCPAHEPVHDGRPRNVPTIGFRAAHGRTSRSRRTDQGLCQATCGAKRRVKSQERRLPPAGPRDYVGGTMSINHDSYPDAYIRGILNTVKSIAMVGISPKDNRPSYFAFKYLLERGYSMIPVN